MPVNKENSVEVIQSFTRGSKSRKSFRISHRCNSKLPPAARIFMKTMEHNKVKKFDSSKYKSFIPKIIKVDSADDEELIIQEDFNDDEQKLISQSPILSKHNSFR